MSRLLAVLIASSLWACAAHVGAADPASTSKPSEDCGAENYQYLLGQQRSKIPHRPAGANWRVYSTKDIITMDYVFGRMDIVWDADTGVVKNVHCG